MKRKPSKSSGKPPRKPPANRERETAIFVRATAAERKELQAACDRDAAAAAAPWVKPTITRWLLWVGLTYARGDLRRIYVTPAKKLPAKKPPAKKPPAKRPAAPPVVVSRPAADQSFGDMAVE